MTAVTKYRVLKERFYSIEDFDNIIVVQSAQVCFLVFALLFVYVTYLKILRTVYSHEKLHMPGNVIVCCLFINDMLNVTQFSVSSGIMIISGKVWLNDALGKTLAITVQLLKNLQAVLFAIGSTEKLLYCVFPFKHARFFTVRKTLICISTLYVIVVITTVVDVLHREVVFVPSMLTCFGTIQSENRSENSALVIFRYCSVIAPGSWTFWTQLIIFIFSIKKRGRLQSEHEFIRRKLFVSFLTLFAVCIVDVIGRVWRLLIINVNGIPSVIGRTGMFFYIFGPAVVNPLIVIFGNKPLRKDLKDKKTLPVWLIEIQKTNQQRRTLPACPGDRSYNTADNLEERIPSRHANNSGQNMPFGKDSTSTNSHCNTRTLHSYETVTIV